MLVVARVIIGVADIDRSTAIRPVSLNIKSSHVVSSWHILSAIYYMTWLFILHHIHHHTAHTLVHIDWNDKS